RQEITLAVLLVLVAIDHDRLRYLATPTGGVAAGRRGLPRAGRRIGRVRIRITNRQCQPLRIRRPLVPLQPALDLGELKCLAAAAVQQPHLVPFGFARTGRRERQVLAVWTEIRRRLAVGARRNLPLVLAVDADR